MVGREVRRASWRKGPKQGRRVPGQEERRVRESPDPSWTVAPPSQIGGPLPLGGCFSLNPKRAQPRRPACHLPDPAHHFLPSTHPTPRPSLLPSSTQRSDNQAPSPALPSPWPGGPLDTPGQAGHLPWAAGL